MSHEAGQRRGETEAVRQHVFGTGLAELAPGKLVAVKELPDNGLGGRRIDVAFFHGRTSREPVPGCHVLFDLLIIGREILLHHAVAVGAAEVEDIVRVLLKQIEVQAHGLQNVLIDGGWIFPAPLRIQVRVANHVQRRLLG